jgi:hypothetical protein
VVGSQTQQQQRDTIQAEQDAGLGHADVELPRDVEREERKHDRGADLVDEVDAHDNPEFLRKLMVKLKGRCAHAVALLVFSHQFTVISFQRLRN